MPSSGIWRRAALVNNRRYGGPCHLHHKGDKNRRVRNNVSSIGNVLSSNISREIANPRRTFQGGTSIGPPSLCVTYFPSHHIILFFDVM
jgi:hypothetical protein